MSSIIESSEDRARREAALENSSTLKAMSVLEALVRAPKPPTLSELMQLTGLPKPSLHRTLALFEDAGFVQREPTGRAYAVGPRLAALGLSILSNDAVATLKNSRTKVKNQLVGEWGFPEPCADELIDHALSLAGRQGERGGRLR